jgi:uncharacterized protein YecE (DUF72 family)
VTGPPRASAGGRSPVVRTGTSGWSYPEWRGDFYPDGLAQRRHLSYLAGQVDSVELNGTFYGAQRPSSFRSWAQQTPDGFLFAVKGSKTVTHVRRLHGATEALADFFAGGVLALGPKLGPVLWQLPPSLTFRADRFAEFLALLPTSTPAAVELAGRHSAGLPEDRMSLDTDADRPIRHAVEVRHPSFLTPQATGLLREFGVAMVVADTAGTWPYVEELTSDDLVYVRLHGGKTLYRSDYPEPELRAWAAKIAGWAADRDVVCYFDNTAEGHAPYNALRLAELLGQFREHPVGELGPQAFGPVTEDPVGEHHAGRARRRVDPQERAGLPEVTEGLW